MPETDFESDPPLQCWYCRRVTHDTKCQACPNCQRLLRPSREEARRLASHIDFLMIEMDRWKTLPPEWVQSMRSRYQARKQRLLKPPPLATPERPAPLAHRPPDLLQQRLHQLSQAPETRDVAPSPALELPHDSPQEGESIGQFLTEMNVRWFHMLGALMVSAAFLIFLKANWEGIGKELIAVLMTLSPALFFFLSFWLRDRLPQSSRLMAVAGGLVMPTGLLSLNHFHVLGLNMPSTIWSPLCFAISATVLAQLARSLGESACVYLAGTSIFLAGLTTGSSILTALVSFGGAAGLLLAQSRHQVRDEYRSHFRQLSHLLGAAGLLSGIFRSQSSWESASTVFLLASVYYAGSAYLAGSVRSLVVSSLTGMFGFWACQNLFHLSAALVGLGSLIQGSLYLSRARSLLVSEDERERSLGNASYWFGVSVTGGVLILSLGWTLCSGLWNSFAALTPQEQWTCILTGILGAFYYGAAAAVYRRPALLYVSAASFTYAYFVLSVRTWQSQPDVYRILLVLLPLLWQTCALVLRSYIPREYLTPWVLSGTALAALIAPINLLMQLHHNSMIDVGVYLAISVACLVAALWMRSSHYLYLGLSTLVMGYGSWLPTLGHSQHPNVGLCFVPLVALLTGVAWTLAGGARESQFAPPVGRFALALGLAFSLSQSQQIFQGEWSSATLTLALYAGGFAVAGQLFRGWTTLSTPTRWFCWLWATLCLLTCAACWGHFSNGAVMGVLVACALLTLIGRFHRDLDFAAPAGLVWSTWNCCYGPAELALAASFLWLTLTLNSRRERAAYVSLASLLLAAVAIWRAGLTAENGTLLIGLMFCQLLVSWFHNDTIPMINALLTGVFGWYATFKIYPANLLVPAWWLFQAIFSGFSLMAHLRGRAQLGREGQWLSSLLAGFILMGSAIHGWWGCATAFVYAASFSLVGLATGRLREFAVGSSLLAWGLFLSSLHTHWRPETMTLVWMLTGMLYLALSSLVPSMAEFCRQFSGILSLFGWVVNFASGAPLVGYALGAMLWTWRSLLEEGNLPRHAAFFFVYSAWLNFMPPGSPLEFVTLPVALWLLLGPERFATVETRTFGLFLLLAPSVFLSLAAPVHAIWGLVLGFAALLLSSMTHNQRAFSAGGAAILIEIAIQALKAAVNLPVYLVLLLLGSLTIALGIWVERRRRG